MSAKQEAELKPGEFRLMEYGPDGRPREVRRGDDLVAMIHETEPNYVNGPRRWVEGEITV